MTDQLDEVRGRLATDYRVESELGRGGMAVVYRAVDLRHDRPVAIKVMRPEVMQGLGSDRFLREIQLAARLTHPRIVAVYASGDADGLLYYVMPFVEGPTLRQRLEQGPLPVREAVGIARDVARALAYAHSHGVIHRDIKPENIMLPAGEAVVTDFGVARSFAEAESTRLTTAGLAIGTLAYMSPEQAFGGGDPRADVYSLGCVLYEMLTGRPPFDSPNALVILARHASEVVPSIQRADLPPGVVAATLRCLAKEPEGRPTAIELEEALRRAVEDPGTLNLSSAESAGTRTIAVLPLLDLSQDQSMSYLCEGIAEELLDCLSRVPSLRVASRASAFAVRDPSLDLREKARRLGVQSALEGSVRAAGDRIRVGVQLSNASDGFQLWSHRFEGSLGDVFAIEDQIAQAVVEALHVAPAKPAAPMVGPPTASLEAHRQYLLGRQAWRRRTGGSLTESIELFGEAARLDPGFALAYVGLAEARILQAVYGALEPGVAMAAARAAANRALELNPHLGEGLSARASVSSLYDWNWAESERDFVTAVERHPGYATARQWYAMHLLAPLGRFADARSELERARLADPLSPSVLASLGQVALFAGAPEEASRLHRSALELEPDFGAAHFFLGQALLEAGDIAAALESLARAVELTGGSSEVIAFQALAEGKAGHPDRATALLDLLGARVETGYVSPVLRAIGLLGLGQLDRALDALEQAADLKATDLVWLKVRPTFAALRGNLRFQTLLDRLRLG
jgi:eukaryotic-like serine/threonine-protein kinase